MCCQSEARTPYNATSVYLGSGVLNSLQQTANRDNGEIAASTPRHRNSQVPSPADIGHLGRLAPMGRSSLFSCRGKRFNGTLAELFLASPLATYV
jgi:hypothetical protein